MASKFLFHIKRFPYLMLKRIGLIMLNKGVFSTKVIKNALILIPTETLLDFQYKQSGFNRMDIIVRYLAVESYYGLNDVGFDLYNKMQTKRGAYPLAEQNFKALIESIANNGFDNSFPIPVDSYGNVKDGAHRLTLAIYFNIKQVAVDIVVPVFKTGYGLTWFQDNGFSENECEIILNKKDDIFFRNGLFFPIISVSESKNLFGEVSSKIGKRFRIVKTSIFSHFEKTDQYPIEWYNLINIDIGDYTRHLSILWVEILDQENVESIESDFKLFQTKIAIKNGIHKGELYIETNLSKRKEIVRLAYNI